MQGRRTYGRPAGVSTKRAEPPRGQESLYAPGALKAGEVKARDEAGRGVGESYAAGLPRRATPRSTRLQRPRESFLMMASTLVMYCSELLINPCAYRA